MLNKFKKLGIDKPIMYTILSRSIQAFGSIFSVFLITSFLSKDEQGYYYTFASILAIQIFFELGFNGIIVQYVAHETAHIKSYLIVETEIEKKALSRLSHLLRFCLKWFSALSVVLLMILSITGYYFFTKFEKGLPVEWGLPWFILVISTMFHFILSPILSYLEGLGKIKEVAKIRLIQQIVMMVSLWLLLISGAKLYSGAIANLTSVLIVIVIVVFSDFKKTLHQIWNKKDKWLISYKKEIFPYQWKIAISWMSGYFLFQLFNPVLFATEGPAVAGQMGLTLAAVNGVLNLTISWMTTKVPVFSKFIAQKEYSQLDSLFNKTIKQSMFVNGLGIVVLIAIVYTFHFFNLSIAQRFLPLELVFMMGLSVFISQVVFSWATYLRCHKEEPYLIPSVFGAVCVAGSTLFFGNMFGVYGVVIGYICISISFLPYNFYIFRINKKRWHEE